MKSGSEMAFKYDLQSMAKEVLSRLRKKHTEKNISKVKIFVLGEKEETVIFEITINEHEIEAYLGWKEIERGEDNIFECVDYAVKINKSSLEYLDKIKSGEIKGLSETEVNVHIQDLVNIESFIRTVTLN